MQPTNTYLARIENIYFLARIGASLRWATAHIVREELPDLVAELLCQLEHTEATRSALEQRAGNDR